jgi:carbon storage regulator
MLVLTRRVGEEIVVPQCQMTVTVLEATAGKVRLGISAPPEVAVYRSEVCAKQQAKTAVDAGGRMESVRILIADRDAFLLAAYHDHLSRYGAVVVTATTGLECLERLRDFAPDVLVLEPAILWGGGEGVLAAIDDEPQIRPAAVLLITNGGDRSLLYRLSPYRVDDYRIKPIAPRQLTQCISALRTLAHSDSPPRTNPQATGLGGGEAVSRVGHRIE